MDEIKYLLISFQQQQQQSSAAAARRVGPVMGNRGLESQRMSSQQDRSRTKTKMGQTTKDSSRTRGSPRSSRKAQQDSLGSAGTYNSYIANLQALLSKSLKVLLEMKCTRDLKKLQHIQIYIPTLCSLLTVLFC